MMLNMKKMFLLLGVCLAFAACNDKPKETVNQPADEETVITGSPIALYTDSIAQDSLRADLYLNRARAYMADEQVGAAMMDVNKAITLNPDNVDSYLMLADIYYMLGDETNINATLNRAAEIDPFDARPLVKLGELNLLQQNFNLAAAYIDKALKVNSYNPKAYFVKGMYFIVAEQDTVNALKNFQYAYEQDGNFYDPAELICRIYAVQRPPFALEYIRNVQKKFPDRANARYELALYLQENGEPEEALLHYDTLLMQQPDNYMVVFNQAYVNFVYLRDNETALGLFNRALELNPDYLDALFNKGRVLEQMGKYADAFEVYKEVLNRQKDYELAVQAINRIQNQAEE